MEKPYYLFVDNRGRTRKIPRLYITVGSLSVLGVFAILVLVTMVAVNSISSVRAENGDLHSSLKVKETEINVLMGSQKQFETNIEKVQSELSSIKKNFETYKTEVEKNVR